MQRVAVVAVDGVVAFDLATPNEVLGRVRLPNGQAGYRVRVCGVSRRIDAGAFQIKLDHGLDELSRADTIILAGVADVTAPVPDALVQAVRAAASAGVRIASICSGAFLLAATGLLDGRRATTHWLAAAELKRLCEKGLFTIEERPAGMPSKEAVHGPPSVLSPFPS